MLASIDFGIGMSVMVIASTFVIYCLYLTCSLRVAMAVLATAFLIKSSSSGAMRFRKRFWNSFNFLMLTNLVLII